MIGNMIGRGPHFIREATKHFPILNVVLVGATSKGRKGTSANRVRSLLADTILEALRSAPTGMSRAEISNRLGRNVSKDRIEQALSLLVKYSRAHVEFRPTNGRPTELWMVGV